MVRKPTGVSPPRSPGVDTRNERVIIPPLESAQKLTGPRLVTASLGVLEAGPIDGFPAPNGHTVVVNEETFSDRVRLPNGKVIALAYSQQRLAVRNEKSGKVVELEGPPNGFAELKKRFRDELADLEPKQMSMARSWSADGGYTGYSTIGHLISVIEGAGLDLGGPQPTYKSRPRTFDIRNGKAVRLDDLGPQRVFREMVATAERRLPMLRAPGFDAEASTFTPRTEELAELMATQFAAMPCRAGVVRFDMACEAGAFGAETMLAKFGFDVPLDAKLAKAIGHTLS